MKFEIYRNKNKRYRFILLSGNGQTILSSQDYKAKQSAKKGIASIQKNISKESRFRYHNKKNGQSYFHLKAGNGEIIADSQLYSNEKTMHRSIKSLMKSIPKATIIDRTKGM